MAGRTPGATTRRRRPVALLLTILLGAPLVLLLTWPQAVGAQQLMLVSQAISFRGPLAIAGVVLAVVFGTAAALRRRAGVAAGLAVILVALAAGNAGVLLARGSGAPAADGEVTVLAWNTLGGAVAPEDIADLVLATGADIVSLPETDERAVAAVARLVRTGGREMSAATAYGATGDSRYPTSVLVSEELGEYRIDPSAGSTPDLPSAVLRPVDGDGPAIVAVHPLPPLPFTMGPWRGGLRWIAEACDGPDVIVAGDFNATVDHFAGLGAEGGVLGRCRDAAASVGAAAQGTWPVSAPSWLAAPIDHVLVGSAWSVRAFEVVTSADAAGSDHRPVLARLERR